ncbi:recombinase [Azospirillum melinis]|uniref:recombinase n=1 Tax=Azospirillum melinis TaxID=328839 RepID=UPI00157BA09D|nr:recombinase [Azospirillum melinis]
MKERLLGADVVAAFIEEIVVAQRRDQAEARNRRGNRERALAGTDRKIASILEAVENGMYSPSLKERLSALKVERTALVAEIDALGTEAPEMMLPANLPELYRRKIAELESVFGEGDEGMAAMEMIRPMVDRVVLSPAPRAPGWRRSFMSTCWQSWRRAPRRTPDARTPRLFRTGASSVGGCGGRI